MNWREEKIESGSIGCGLRRSACDEGGQRGDPDRERRHDHRRPDALLGRLDQREGDAGEPERGERPSRGRSSAPVIVGSRVSGMWRRDAQTTKAPSGRLIRKIARQLTASIR